MQTNTPAQAPYQAHCTLKPGRMIEASDIANAFCEDIGRQLRHPKCTTFFMSSEQVYEKVEVMCEKGYEATDGREKTEFNEAVLWEIIASIKKNSPHLLQNDNSISKKVKDCTLCQKKQGQYVHKKHLLCQQCQQMVLELEGEDPSTPTILQCYYCHSIEDLVAYLDVIHCPSCLHMVKQITRRTRDSA